MSPLQQQVVRRYLATFFVATIVMTAAIIAFDAVKVLLDQGLTPVQTAFVLPFLTPAVCRTAMQGAVLFAACFVYGRMSARNELLALNASGLSIISIIWPALLLSVPLSFACVWLDDVSETWGKNGIRRVLCEGIVDIAYGQLQSKKVFRADDYELTVLDVAGRKLIRPMLTRTSKDLEDRIEIEAALGEIRFDWIGHKLNIVLEQGTVMLGDHERLSFANTFEHSIPIETEESCATSWDRIREQERRIEELTAGLSRGPGREKESRVTTIPAYVDDDIRPLPPTTLTSAQFEIDDDDEPAVSPPSADEKLLKKERGELFWRRALWHQKWANSFCCLTFTLIGIPVAVRMRNADYLSSFMACFLPVLAIYQPLQYFGMAYATRGVIAPIWLHLNNILLGALGVYCLGRMLQRR